jgi:hypothetical protein
MIMSQPRCNTVLLYLIGLPFILHCILWTELVYGFVFKSHVYCCTIWRWIIWLHKSALVLSDGPVQGSMLIDFFSILSKYPCLTTSDSSVLEWWKERNLTYPTISWMAYIGTILQYWLQGSFKDCKNSNDRVTKQILGWRACLWSGLNQNSLPDLLFSCLFVSSGFSFFQVGAIAYPLMPFSLSKLSLKTYIWWLFLNSMKR